MDLFASIDRHPRLMQGVSRVLNKYGDKALFGGIGRVRPIETNPAASTGIHTAVPHRYLYAYLTAIKSLLRYDADFAVYVHDDGSLRDADKALIRRHLPGVTVVDRAWADDTFARRVGDDFLVKVRKSYTSYLKLFDPTLVTRNERIVIVDTDVLFLNRPQAILSWAKGGGAPWFHRSGPWHRTPPVAETAAAAATTPGAVPQKHIQHLVVEAIPEINRALDRKFSFVHGFNSGLLGYDRGAIDYGELNVLLKHLYGRFGEHIFRWGSEQTMHGLVLCGQGAVALPMDQFMVFTEISSDQAPQATFVHFIGEFRYRSLLYPRLATKVIRELRH